MRSRVNVRILMALAVAIAVGGTGLWWWTSATRDQGGRAASSHSDRRILYYRNPMGEADTSPVPKKDSMGMDYIPVYADEAAKAPAAEQSSKRRILFYRNPMGLADTSDVPKLDSMGMNYIPVYDDEAAQVQGAVKLSLDKVQRLGVRTAAVTRQVLNETVVVTGTVTADERRETVVSLKFRANITKLLVAATGEKVQAGQALFELQSPFLLKEELDLALALRNRAVWNGAGGVYARSSDNSIQSTRERLRLYEVPEREIERLISTQQPTGRIVWPARRAGIVLEKLVVEGMQAEEGQVLYRLADLSSVWVIAEVPERALSIAGTGAGALITLSAYPGKTFDGKVTFVYPEVVMATRTVKVRIELANTQGLLLPGMFASVELSSAPGEAVLTVPEDALIDSGQRQVVLVARGEGLFEPRKVTVGRRANGRVEIRSGLSQHDTVVTSATFLIDAESNLRAALQSFTAGDGTLKESTP